VDGVLPMTRLPRVTLLILVLSACAAGPARGQVDRRLEDGVARVEDAAAATFGRSLPLPSASAGVSYAFDPATGNFQRQPSTFGQVYLDRADPIGARRLNVQFAYQYVQLQEIDGYDANDLRDPAPIYVPGKAAALVIPRLDVSAALHQFLFAGTYGLTDDLEVSLAVPVIYSDLFAGVQARLLGVLQDGSVLRRSLDLAEPQRTVGVGDLLLRAKYRIVEADPVHVSAGLLLRLPTGSTSQLRGVGFLEVAPAVLASTRVFRPATWARLQGHLNASVGFDTEDVGQSEARWGIGLDWGISENVTAAVALLGRNQFGRVAPPGFFDLPRCPGASLAACATDPAVRGGTAPLFGLSGERPDYYDVSIGGRGAVWRDTVFAFANVLVPLNDGFVRTAPIPLVGVEATF
jgi:hypothetical protein